MSGGPTPEEASQPFRMGAIADRYATGIEPDHRVEADDRCDASDFDDREGTNLAILDLAIADPGHAACRGDMGLAEREPDPCLAELRAEIVKEALAQPGPM